MQECQTKSQIKGAKEGHTLFLALFGILGNLANIAKIVNIAKSAKIARFIREQDMSGRWYVGIGLAAENANFFSSEISSSISDRKSQHEVMTWQGRAGIAVEAAVMRASRCNLI